MKAVCLLAVLAGWLPAQAAAAEHWAAVSNTALSITGNVTFTPDRITFQNRQSLPLALVGRLPGFTEMGETVEVTLYRVTAPADPPLLRGNRLCGGGAHAVPVTYVAVWSPRPLAGDKAPRSIEVFSGPLPPRAAGDGSCGTYNYDAGG